MVLVCNDPEFVFLKTRKTAGTSIEMALEPCCTPAGHKVEERTDPIISSRGVVGARLVRPRSERMPKILERVMPPEWHSHMSALDVRRRMGAKAFSQTLKLSAVRNPFHRTVSMFHWQMKSKGIEILDAHADFAKWIHGDWPDDQDVVAIDGKTVVDRFIRFEHLAEDLRAFAKDVGLSLDLSSLPHAKNNADARKGDVSAYFDSESSKIVRDRLGWAFEAGSYPEDVRHSTNGEIA